MRTQEKEQVGSQKTSRASLPIRELAVASMIVASCTSGELVSPALGSGVCIAVYDPVTKIGGMLHTLLPDSALDRDLAAHRPQMFVDTGLPALMQAVVAFGGVESRLCVTAAGGAEYFGKNANFNIGRRNIESATAMLARKGMKLRASRTGGHESRILRLDLNTGEVTLETPGRKAVKL